MLQILVSSNSIDVNIEYKFIRDLNIPYEYTLYQVEKKTPLHIAVERNNVEAVRLLLSHKSIDVKKMSSLKIE